MSRTEKSLKNIECALAFQAFSMLMTFFVRRVFVSVLTQEYLGLDGVFSNALSLLSLAELGIGSAFSYSLYKPLAERDREQTAAIMSLFRRVYQVVGLSIACLGAALIPALPRLVRGLPDLPHIHIIYLLFVLDSALSYFFLYKQTLLIADQRKYVTTVCGYGIKILMQPLQAAFLWRTGNYFVYLGFKFGTTLLGNLVLSRWTNRLYPYISYGREHRIDPQIKQDIQRNTRALLIHKMGNAASQGMDSLLLTYFVGVISVGLYSNYLMITAGLNRAYEQLFSSLTASVGNLGVTTNPEQASAVFRRINFAGNWLYGFSAVCLMTLLNPFIELWVGEDYLFDQGIVCLIVVNFYVSGMRKAVTTFRWGYGLYRYNRYMPAAESLLHLVLSSLLAIPFHTAGILAGALISVILTGFWIEPLVLFRHGFSSPAGPFFRDYALNTLITLLTGAVVWWACGMLPGEGAPLFAAKMAICAVGGNAGYLIAYRRREEFRYFLRLIANSLPMERRKRHER